MKILFESCFSPLTRRPLGVPIASDVLKAEPQLFGADFEFAWDSAGFLTRAFLDRLTEEPGWDNAIVDSRVHMLMPGMYPCIPGWHLDDVPRTRPDGQPDHADPSYYAEHVAMCVGSNEDGVSVTEFAIGDISLEDVPVGGGVVYRKWHDDIEAKVAAGDVEVRAVPHGRLFRFGFGDFHRGAPATSAGWRMFIRATRYTERAYKNELRHQTQVYLTEPFAGW